MKICYAPFLVLFNFISTRFRNVENLRFGSENVKWLVVTRIRSARTIHIHYQMGTTVRVPQFDGIVSRVNAHGYDMLIAFPSLPLSHNESNYSRTLRLKVVNLLIP